MSVSRFFDEISDAVTRVMGSTTSIIVHTTLFLLIFLPLVFGWQLDKILLVLTTAVSLEAIYMSIFIQRSVNKQSARLDEVVEEIRSTVKETHQAVIKVIAQETDDVVREISEHVTEETDELAQEITEHVTEENDELVDELTHSKKSESK